MRAGPRLHPATSFPLVPVGRTVEIDAHSANNRGAAFMGSLIDKLFDPRWLLIEGIAIALIAIIVAKFPQRPD